MCAPPGRLSVGPHVTHHHSHCQRRPTPSADALVACFKTCSFLSAFTGCCTAEHAAFWACYTAHRGRNDTVISSWVDDKLRRDSTSDD